MSDNRRPVVQNRPRMGPGSHGATIESARDVRTTVLRLARYLHPHRRQLAGVGALVIIGTLLDLAGPILLGKAIDNYVIPGNLAGLFRIVIVMLLVYMGSNIASAGQALIMVNLAQRLIGRMRAQLFDHLQTLSMRYHDDHDAGDLMSRITNDTDVISQVLANGLTQLIANVLMLVGILVAMIVLSWQLALGTVLILPVMLLITGAIAGRARGAFREVQRNLGKMNAMAEETIAGVRVVQAFARTSETVAEFNEINAVNRDVGVKAEVITAALGPMFSTMSTLTIALIAGVGGWLAIRGLVSVGIIVSFVAYTNQFFRPLRMLAQLYNQLQSGIAGAERIFEVLDEQPSVGDLPNARPVPAIEGDVVFDHVTFAYEPDEPVLVDISMHASPGQTIALVGPTGAGKTTFISLLSRFYDVQSGAILVDGQDIRQITQESLRKQLGIVLQDTFLFSDTVKNNLRYGRLDATDEEIYAAARLANADQFITRLPEGYDTPVSEQGSNFSQGQRQLLAIARAILADPRILILDEATSSVDTRTEMRIQQALLRLLEGRTAFVIAHRLSTIRNADQVLVVYDHRIIERGTHEQLLAQRGFYYDLYNSQFRRVEEAAGENLPC